MALMSTLTDAFATNDLATLWGSSYGTVTWSSGKASVQCDSGYSSALGSTGTYTLTGSYFYAHITPFVSAGASTYVQLTTDGSNYVTLTYTSGDIEAAIVQGGGYTYIGDVAYNATSMAWWRIRELSGTIYFDTAPDGVTWTNQFSTAYTMSLASMSAWLYAGGSTATGDSAIAGVNTAGGALSATATLPIIPTLSASARHGHAAGASLSVTPSEVAGRQHAATAGGSLSVTPTGHAVGAGGSGSRTATAALAVTPALSGHASVTTPGGLVYMGGYQQAGSNAVAADWAIAQGLPNADGGFQSVYQWGTGWTGTNSVEQVQVGQAEAFAGYPGPCCLSVAMTQSDTETDLSSALSGSSLTSGCSAAHAATAVACLANGVQFIKMAWEFNGGSGYNWMPPWGSYTAAEFKLLWQLIYNVYSSAAVSAGKPANWFKFIYCLVQNDPNGTADLVNFFPGMPYAAYLTIDEYDRSGGGYTGWNEALFDPPTVTQMVTVALAQGCEGVGFPEWGIRNDAYGPTVIPDPAYITSAFAWMKATTEQGLNVLAWPWGAGYTGSISGITDPGGGPPQDTWNFGTWPTMWSALTSAVATGISQGWVATTNPTSGGGGTPHSASASLAVAPGLTAHASGGSPNKTATAALTVTPALTASPAGGAGAPAVDPARLAARAGMPGDLTAVNLAQQADQFLATHAITPVYPGAQVTGLPGADPDPSAGINWARLGTADVDQPFTMSGTAIGRVTLPLSPAGNGADVVVSLCADSGGTPGATLASTTVPAAHLAQLAAPDGLASAGPLATAQSNTMVFGAGVNTPWTQPAVSLNGSGTYNTPVTSGNYAILLGGFDTTGDTTVATVSSVAYLGGGMVSGPVPQPALPRGAWFGMAAATIDTVVFAGGVNGASYLSNVWTASWDPTAGTVGAWTAQTSLPAANVSGAMAASGTTVYVIGGNVSDGSATSTAAVWYASAVNGQIQSWAAGPSLPRAVSSPYVAVVNGWLVVAGGVNASGTALTQVWYSAIGPTGALGGWQAGPSLPSPAYAFGPGWNTAVADSAIAIVAGTTSGGTLSPYTQTLTVTPDGPAAAWQTGDAYAEGVFQTTCFPGATAGQWEVFNLHLTSYDAIPLVPVPQVSVPLPATGLTNGGTYHILLHQPAGDLNDYTAAGLDPGALPTAAQSRPNGGGSWSGYPDGYAMLAGAWNQSPGGPLLHLWEDSGARVTTLIEAAASGELLGLVEATALPAGPLNANPAFASGTAGWSAAGGTITVSSAETHGGFPSSGLLTPSGSASVALIETAPFPVTAGAQYTVSGWFWSPVGYAVGLSVTWLDSQGNEVSAAGVSVTLPASTWTLIAGAPFIPPAGAAQGQVVIAESGTPTTGDLLYCSDVTAAPLYPGVVSAVTQVDYSSAGQPTGTVQLA